MKKILLISLVSLFALSLTGCQSPDPIRDGVCTKFNPGGLPAPIDPDCFGSSRSNR